MKERRFGPLGRKVPVIGQGTWRVRGTNRAESIRALRRGLDLGMTHIDTAEMYDDAELVVAEAVAGRRDEVFLVSKVLPGNATKSGTIRACEKSLRRLGVEHLDCYLLHWRGRYALEGTIEAFERLQAGGKIASWGVSNFDVDDLGEAAAIAGPGRIACNQVLYHLGQRGIEHAVLPWCEEQGVAVVAYTPFGPDAFPGPRSKAGAALAAVAAAHDATPRQVALAFLVRGSVSFTIPKSSDAEHTTENAGAGTLELSAHEIDSIDAAFPRGAKPRTLPML